MSLVSEEDRRKIATAIRTAEARTSGETVAVIAAESASYLSVPVMIAALAALLVPWPFIYFTWATVQSIYMMQLIVFIVALAVLMPRPVRFRFVPRSMKRSRAHGRAIEQFLAHELDSSIGRNGVLVYVSVAERYAEIIADKGLHDKVSPSEWQSIIDDMTALIGEGKPGEAIAGAITKVGAIMAQHFPATGSDVRRLPDHLIVLD
jgi:putative membrane protein